MARILPSLSRQRTERYDLWRVVNSRVVEQFPDGNKSIQFICDIDKTYLETEFESLVKMAKIAFFEGAHDKVTVEGAAEVLLALRWGDMNDLSQNAREYPRPLHFVSSSPPQLRGVLEEKLTLDGLDWSSDTFKDQAYNIRKGRFDLLRHQVAYKSAAIINLMKEPLSSYYMLGDSAESDAYIYLGIKLFLEKKISLEAYKNYLSFSGVEKSAAEAILTHLYESVSAQVSGILIRNLPKYHFISEPPLTDPIFLFADYYDVVLYFAYRKLLAESQLWHLTRIFHNFYRITPNDMLDKINWFRQRGLLDCEFTKRTRDKLYSFVLETFENINDQDSMYKWNWNNLAEFESLREEDILTLSANWAIKLKQRRHS